MNFRFDIQKATEAAGQFLARAGGSLNVMKLVKLIYLLDRLSIARRGVPVVGGTYFSMRNGPVTSELLDLINAGGLANEADQSWEQLISDRKDHKVALRDPRHAPRDHPSDYELRLIDEIFASHGAMNQWQLRDWCHQHCGEWTPLQTGRELISVEELAFHAGCSREEASRIADEARESNLIAAALALRWSDRGAPSVPAGHPDPSGWCSATRMPMTARS